ncbi:MAG: SbcC/MukB-like Walker B domain-containing protein, partial [Calditrichota bacterium]
QEFKQEIAASDFESAESVQDLLALDLDAAAESKALEEFFTGLQAAALHLKEQQKQMNSVAYDENLHSQLRENIELLENELSAKQQQIGSLESEIVRIESGIKKRFELQKELDALNSRKENIDTLLKLFRGSGFVNYVSSVFLKNLVGAANERFRSLTRNQLSLEVNEDNNFMVRDYLNDGQVRSVKTLSGGQTFQASLCLALALADNIQHLSEASQNFFFLDEGFGTLDKNSLQIIFNTLKAMQKENRIVGVISHVEELQQEIDVYLYIRNEDEKGSEVKTSWQ